MQNPLDAVIVGLAIPVSLAVFGRAAWRKLRLMKALAPSPDPIAEHPQRIRELITIFLGQRKLFQEFTPGLMHAVIFWGFCTLLLRALTLFGMVFFGFDFHLPGLAPGTLLGECYGFVKSAANAAVCVMVLLALWRRYVQRVPRLKNTGEALFVLLMILNLMLSDMVFEACLRSEGSLSLLGHAALLDHCLGILVFLAYLPSGKHMHVLSSVFNVYLRPLRRSGRLLKLDLADEKIEVFGTPHVDELSWKDGLDLYTCTECGRCNEACPAQATGKKLAPREIITAQKLCLTRESGRLLDGKAGKPEEIMPEQVTPEEIWACTTCQACEQACPVNIAHVQRINSLRRSETLMASRFPSELKRVFKGLETNANPWGLAASGRTDWAKDLELPLFKDKKDAEYLLYLGCAASFDDRARKVSRSLIALLKKAGVSFAVLGEQERCCGETARRLGEEALGQSLAEENVKLFGELGVKKILTSCPHCFNTLKNEYPDFGGNYEVIHHTQLLQELVAQGRLKPAVGVAGKLTIHDSCYLGRVNGVYAPARDLLSAVPGAQLSESPRSHDKGFCCGAGGGRFWLEEHGSRINHERVKQLCDTGAGVVATSCPYCLTMLENGAKDLGREVQIKDLAELL